MKSVTATEGESYMADVENSSFRQKMAAGIGKFAGSRFVRAIMDAGYSVISFSIVGAIFLILTVIPQVITAPGFVSFWNNTIGRFSNMFTVLYNANMGILALIFSGTFAYSYTRIYRDEEKLDMVPMNGLLMFLMGMFITVPQMVIKNGVVQFVQSLNKNNIIGGGIAVSNSGITRISASGIFTGLIVAWITVQIYRFTIKHNLRIKMPASVPSGVANSFSALIPSFCVAVAIGLIEMILIACGTDIYNILYIPFSFITNIINTWWGMLIYIFLEHFLWWFGIHGAAIMGSFITPISLANMAANVKGANYIWAADPGNAFVTIGGSGATLGVAIWLLLRARSSQLKEIGKVEIVPAIFNINEPLIFGLPIVYNVELGVPFILAPCASMMVYYIGRVIGFVPKIIVQQPWPTPIGLGGLIATVSWRGAVWAVLCAVVAFLIWYPFIKHYDSKLLKQEQAKAAAEAKN